MEPRLSVVIPTTGERLTSLDAVLMSLTGQSGIKSNEWELHVVSDSGSDRVVSLVDTYARHIKAYHHWSQGPQEAPAGAAKARNLGLKLSRARRVLFIDDDCLCPENLVEAHARHQWNETLGLIGFRRHISADTHFDKYNPQGYHTVDSRPDRRRTDEVVRTEKMPTIIHKAWTCHISYPARKIKGIGGFWEEMKGSGYEDLELALRAWRVGVRFSALPEPTVYHLDHPQSPLQAQHAPTNRVLFEQTRRDTSRRIRGSAL